MTAPLRIGLDGRAFDSPAAGVRRYVHELTKALLALGEPLTLVALGGKAASSPALDHIGEGWHPPTNLGWTMVGVMRAARAASLDVYHAPAYTAPPVGIRRMVITLHDVSYERRPEWYPHRRDRLRRAFYRASARAADLVITDSEFSRDEIVAAYAIAPERIRVIPLGVAAGFVPASAPSPPDTVTTPFVLHVGDLHTRRNLGVALEAVVRLRARGGPFRDLTLVLAGVDHGIVPALQRRADGAGQPGAIKMLGRVDEATLVRLYQSALALVYPSVYEGFGLPLVEAMACGAPVLAADASTSEELIGDAGLRLPHGRQRGLGWRHRGPDDVAREARGLQAPRAATGAGIYLAPHRRGHVCGVSRVRRAMTTDPDISVIIVNFNGVQHLQTCITAVLAQEGPSFEVILVDNASTDGSAEFVVKNHPEVRLVTTTTNLGFAGGNNRGAAVARAPLLAFLNNDTRVEAGWLMALGNGLGWSADSALVTSRIVYMHDPAVLDSAGDGLTRAGGAFKRGHGAPASEHLRRREVFGACGAAFLIVRSVFEEVGGFDEDFFMSHEDVDLSYRVRLRGYRCVYTPDAVVHHVGSASLGRTSTTSVFYGQRNLEWVYLKNTPALILWMSLPLHAIYLAAAFVYFIWAGRFPAFVSAKWAAVKGAPKMLRKRRLVQSTRRARASDIWNMLEPSWFGVKLREKRFDLGIVRPR